MDDVATTIGGAALADVGSWEVVRATGGDRLAFLHRLLTASVDTLSPGQGRRALLLTTKGQIAAELIVCARQEEVRLLVPPGQGAATAAALSRYAIMDDVTFAAESLTVLAVYGSGAASALAEAQWPLPADVTAGAPLSHAEIARPGAADGVVPWVIRVPSYGSDGYWIWADAGTTAELAARLRSAGIAPLAPEVVEGRRIVAGEPKFGAEITGDVFPMEVALDPLIDYTKGCYLGQEPIVRIRDRGHINWRLVGLRLAEPGPISVGDRLETDARPKAGRITSFVALPGQPAMALGLLHVSLPAGITVRVRHEDITVGAEVVALPPPFGPTGQLPA